MPSLSVADADDTLSVAVALDEVSVREPEELAAEVEVAADSVTVLEAADNELALSDTEELADAVEVTVASE